MATIVDGGIWELSSQAAELLADEGVLYKCNGDHRPDLEEIEPPIYHIRHDMPQVGYSTIRGYINDAESRVKHI